MFGIGKKTKAVLQKNNELLEAQLASLRAQHAALVTEVSFWKNNCVDYGNQIEFWQRKNREMLEQIGKESANVDLLAYTKAIREEIDRARPEPSAVAAVIALSKYDTQGGFTSQQPTLAGVRAIEGEVVSNRRSQ